MSDRIYTDSAQNRKMLLHKPMYNKKTFISQLLKEGYICNGNVYTKGGSKITLFNQCI